MKVYLFVVVTLLALLATVFASARTIVLPPYVAVLDTNSDEVHELFVPHVGYGSYLLWPTGGVAFNIHPVTGDYDTGGCSSGQARAVFDFSTGSSACFAYPSASPFTGNAPYTTELR